MNTNSLISFKNVACMIACGILLSLMICCSPSLLKPVATDVDLARTQWADMNMNQLQTGFELYATKCGGCHNLYKPSEFTKEQWVELMPEMAEKALLNKEEESLVLKYILTKKMVGVQP